MHPIVSLRTTAGLLCLLPLLVTGCSSGAASGGGETDSPDAAAADAAIGTSDAAAATSPDSSAALPSFVSNVPGATVVDVGSPPMPNLVLLSLNFLQEASGSQYFQQWLGEVENVGTTPVCFVQIGVAYRDASGATLLTMSTTYSDGAPYATTGIDESIACIPAGAIGSFYQNGFADSSVSIEGVTTLGVQFGSLTDATDVPDPNAPTVSVTVESSAIGYSLAGTITETVGTISNIGYRAYPRDATGLVLAQLEGLDLDSLAPGSSYALTTEDIDSPFTEFRGYATYIEGAGSGGSRVGGPNPQRLRAAAAGRRAIQSATDARSSIVRNRR
jgi:hypothetical protein